MRRAYTRQDPVKGGIDEKALTGFGDIGVYADVFRVRVRITAVYGG